MKTFKIFKANNQFILVTKAEGKNTACTYKTYPAYVIDILKNIGYKEVNK